MTLSLVHDMRAILRQGPERDGGPTEQEKGELSLLAVLEEIQGRYRYLPRDVLILVSERLDIPLSQVYSVATFYNAFSLEPKGQHMFQVCTGTACHVRGAMQVLDRLETRLGVQAGQTSADLEYTLETVNCLGACALGPIVVADGGYEGLMTASKVDRLLKRMKRPVGA
jgi:NADH-quinone oxidoreductase subunit E